MNEMGQMRLPSLAKGWGIRLKAVVITVVEQQ